MKKQILDGVLRPFETIQHSRFKMKRDILAANKHDGFIPLSCSFPSGEKQRITANLNIDRYYAYNKKGEIRRGNYGELDDAERIHFKELEELGKSSVILPEIVFRSVNKYGCKYTLSVDGNRYDIYMPTPNIIASRSEEPKEKEIPKDGDDLEFISISEAARHFGVAINTIRFAVATRGLKSVKGFLFDYGWPDPYIVAVIKKKGGIKNGK